MAFGALRDRVFSSRDVSGRLKGRLYQGGVLAVLLYGCKSWCFKAENTTLLRNWHNKRIREMCRVTMCQTYVHRITSVSFQKRTGVFSLAHYLASRTLLWAGHVARMTKNRAPKRLMLSWVGEPRIAGGQEMTYGRSLGRHLKHAGLEHADGSALAFTEWATLAQDRTGFDIGQPHVRQPRCDTRVSPED